jgi:hypothetical protein
MIQGTFSLLFNWQFCLKQWGRKLNKLYKFCMTFIFYIIHYNISGRAYSASHILDSRASIPSLLGYDAYFDTNIFKKSMKATRQLWLHYSLADTSSNQMRLFCYHVIFILSWYQVLHSCLKNSNTLIRRFGWTALVSSPNWTLLLGLWLWWGAWLNEHCSRDVHSITWNCEVLNEREAVSARWSLPMGTGDYDLLVRSINDTFWIASSRLNVWPVRWIQLSDSQSWLIEDVTCGSRNERADSHNGKKNIYRVFHKRSAIHRGVIREVISSKICNRPTTLVIFPTVAELRRFQCARR